MIDQKRPIKLMVPFNYRDRTSAMHDIQLMASETISPSWYEDWSRDDERDPNDPARGIVQACEAEWYEYIPDQWPDGTAFGLKESVLVKCMEPADYYVTLCNWNGGIVEHYCEFHKPFVRSMY